MEERRFYIYILADKPYGVLYIGMTSKLGKRTEQHKSGKVGFTSRYHVKRLVHVEFYETAEQAILREKRMKKWNRSMKIDLIEKENPIWQDLCDHAAIFV